MSRLATLECPHCGGEAVTSLDGLFRESNAAICCGECGIPGRIVVDDNGEDEWSASFDCLDLLARCRDLHCNGCHPPACAHCGVAGVAEGFGPSNVHCLDCLQSGKGRDVPCRDCGRSPVAVAGWVVCRSCYRGHDILQSARRTLQDFAYGVLCFLATWHDPEKRTARVCGFCAKVYLSNRRGLGTCSVDCYEAWTARDAYQAEQEAEHLAASWAERRAERVARSGRLS